MKILSQIRHALDATFQDLTLRTTGRLSFYTLFVFLFSIISAVAVYIIVKFLISIDEPEFDRYSIGGLPDAIAILGRAGNTGILMLIFLMPFYKSKTIQTTKKYSLGEAFKNLTMTEWFYYVAGLIVSLSLSYYVTTEYRPFMVPQNSLDGIMAYRGLNSGAVFDYWIDTLIFYMVSYLPLLIIALYLIRLKTGKLNFEVFKSNGKCILALLISFIVLSGGFEAVMQIFSELAISFVTVPIENPIIIVIIIAVIFLFFQGIFYMVLSKVFYYCFFGGEKIEIKQEQEISLDEEDLLDQ